jgi:hypothetical protein
MFLMSFETQNETGSQNVAQAGLGLAMFLPEAPECWNYKVLNFGWA